MIPELPPADRCQDCHDSLAGEPVGVPVQTDRGTVADYECGICHTGWTTTFDEHGWPRERSTAPIVPAAAA